MDQLDVDLFGEELTTELTQVLVKGDLETSLAWAMRAHAASRVARRYLEPGPRNGNTPHPGLGRSTRARRCRPAWQPRRVGARIWVLFPQA